MGQENRGQSPSETEDQAEPVYRHYTDAHGFQGITAQGIINANRGRIFVTTDALDPQTAELALFAGNPAYAGHGDFVIEFTLQPGVALLPGTQPNEFVHYGSLRFNRHINVVHARKNPY
jgi:hypothetical protein